MPSYTISVDDGFDSSRSASISSADSLASSNTAASEINAYLGNDGAEPQVDEKYILVTGGLGYIGSHTTLELLKAGYNVIVIDNFSNSYSAVLHRIRILAAKHYAPSGKRMPLLRLHNIDYRNVSALKAVLDLYAESDWTRQPLNGRSLALSKVIGVIHFAAYKAVSESIQYPLRYYANNVSGLVEFCTVLEEYGIKTLVFSSSATVYGTLPSGSQDTLREELCVHKEERYTDDDGSIQSSHAGCNGITNPYGRSKWMCEAILADLCVSDPSWNVVALRYFNPVGCDPSGLLGEEPKGIPNNLVPVVAKVVTGALPALQVFGTDYESKDGTAVRDFIHVTDLAKGHIAALSKATSKGGMKSPFRTFNLGTGSGHTVLDVVHAMESSSGTSVSLKHVGRREGDIGSSVARARRAEEELGWKAEKSLHDAARDVCNFLTLNPEGYEAHR
ncbi:MAG: hypothetical protein M1816_006152 [Peltula sp. TS41687]|nr:MAG: hypothetical protein M1816_006152 [Peltula sp. TS41687]